MKTNWDQVIADLVADKVIAAIGDQLKLPPLMANWLRQQHTGADWYYSYPVGYGYDQIRCDLRGKTELLTMSFLSPDGMRLMELNFHS